MSLLSKKKKKPPRINEILPFLTIWFCRWENTVRRRMHTQDGRLWSVGGKIKNIIKGLGSGKTEDKKTLDSKRY